MKTFLEHVAADILAKHGPHLADTVIVFPNKRASLFLGDHLARLCGKPLWSPQYVTISELFRSHSPLVVGDSIKLVCDLYRVFVECTGLVGETLDHFYGWGEVLLSDFDDVDKSMADASRVFANVGNIHELDDLSYLTEEQTQVIRKFFGHFSYDPSGRLSDQTELKSRFLKLWSHLHDIYCTYNERLRGQSLAYEGALYRSVACDESVRFERSRYIFVGFNVVQAVERELFRRLQREGKAHFYWDFDHYYMPRKGQEPMAHEAGHYIASCLGDFPNELDSQSDEIYNNFTKPKKITYISAQTDNMQARYVSHWLRGQGRIEAGRRTAIVLCNEALLKTVIHCLPDDMGNVNITTGYPLAQTPFSSLLQQLIALQATGYDPNSDRYSLRHVNAMLRHPYIGCISDRHAELYARLNDNGKVYYPRRHSLCIDEGLSLLFGDVARGAEGQSLPAQVTAWIIKVLKHMAQRVEKHPDTPLFRESLFRTYTLMNRLHALMISGDLTVDKVTYQRLVGQIVQGTTIPFHGEPAVGVQVMGVLETRNLDFDHVLLLSCNEGHMPRGVSDTSFIPHNIRRAYGLTTIDHRVAIYSYYFHRLLQRATDITLTYNSATTDSAKNEMSRFMLQLLVESPHAIDRVSLQSGQVPTGHHPRPVAKDEAVMARLMRRFDVSLQPPADDAEPMGALLTPTAINRYIRCPLQFYYRYVCGIKEPDDADDGDIDGRMFGNIFHAAAQAIYADITASGRSLTKSVLQGLLQRPATIERAVDSAFWDALFKLSGDHRRSIDYNGLQRINREVIVAYLRNLIRIDAEQAPIEILGLERDVSMPYEVRTSGLTLTTTLGGRIDRLDCVNDGAGRRVRVVDYKTGSRRPGDMGSLDDIFSAEKISDHSDYYLQTFLYAYIVSRQQGDATAALPVSPALLFIQHAGIDNYDPTLCITSVEDKKKREKVADILPYADDFRRLLDAKVSEMFDPDKPFTPTTNDDTCAQCPYRQLCGI